MRIIAFIPLIYMIGVYFTRIMIEAMCKNSHSSKACAEWLSDCKWLSWIGLLIWFPEYIKSLKLKK